MPAVVKQFGHHHHAMAIGKLMPQDVFGHLSHEVSPQETAIIYAAGGNETPGSPHAACKTMRFHRRTALHLAAGAFALPASPRFTRAQTYPTRAVRIVITFPAGSTS